MRRTYWATTAIVVGECAVGGVMDLFRMAPFYPMLIDLGYPSYLSTILGGAKLAAAVVIAVPGLPRLKEWAYAGVLINMTGAAASNFAAQQYSGMVAPAAFAVLALASWATRPRSRKLLAAEARGEAAEQLPAAHGVQQHDR
ncbi:DoxX family protein [Kribbella sp. WER1]